MEQLELSYSPYGNVERFNSCEKQIGSFFIVTHLPRESELHSYLHKRNKISTADLLIEAKNLKQAKCPASGEIINCGLLFTGILFINQKKHTTNKISNLDESFRHKEARYK